MIRDRIVRLVKKAARRVTQGTPRVPHAPAAARSPPTTRQDWTPPEPEPEPEVELELSAAEVLDRINSGEDVVLVDVRSAHELWSGHARDAILLPMSKIEHGFGVLPKGKLLAIYCAAGARSYGVADYLRRQGYDNAWSIPEGFGGWIEAGGTWLQPEPQASVKLLQQVAVADLTGSVQRVERVDGTVFIDILGDDGDITRDLPEPASTP